MTMTVFLVVILAAMLHAAWNASVKNGGDKFVGMTAISIGHAPLAALCLLFVPSPTAESVPYILAGIALHIGYQILLPLSYRIGDLSQVYPIARGVAPLIVAAISTAFLGVALHGMEMLGVLTIGAGIMSLALVRKSDGLRNGRAAAMALLTGCFIAAYSLVDGTGARIAQTAVGFYGWQAIGTTIVYCALMALWKPGVVREVLATRKRVGLIGGSASFIAYALVVWAFTQTPIALVTALRETSIVFALLIGVFVLKERLDLAKVLSTMITLVGAAVLKSARI